MYFGLAVSIVFHLALLAWAMLTIQSTPELSLPPTPTISVEILTPSDVLRLKQGDETSKHLETKAAPAQTPDAPAPQEAPKPKPVTAAAPPPPPPPAAEPPPPEPAKPEPAKPEPAKPEPPKLDPIADKLAALPPTPAPPDPTPGPTPDDQKKLEEKLEQERAAAEQRKQEEEMRKAAEAKKKADQKKAEDLKKKKLADEKKKREEAKKKFDASKLAAMLDKIPDSPEAPQKALIDRSQDKRGGKPIGSSQTATATGPEAGTKDGRDSVLSLREQDMLKGMINARLRDCWRLPGGGGGVENPIVTVKWHLRPDGTLDGSPTVIQPQSSPTFQLAADAALRAVQCAAPFGLPPDKYASWKEITWQFDPTKML